MGFHQLFTIHSHQQSLPKKHAEHQKVISRAEAVNAVDTRKEKMTATDYHHAIPDSSLMWIGRNYREKNLWEFPR